MTTRARGLGLACGVALAAGGCSYAPLNRSSAQAAAPAAAADRRALAEATIGQWSSTSALVARLTLEEYGVPDDVRPSRLTWNRTGPWLRTVVKDIRPGFEEGDELGVLEQTVVYPLTPTQTVSVAAFDDEAGYEAGTGELTVKSDQESHNFLLANLADDVARGRQSPEQARDSYQSIVDFERAGKSSAYLLGLRFATAP